jgi:hypothetical protein
MNLLGLVLEVMFDKFRSCEEFEFVGSCDCKILEFMHAGRFSAMILFIRFSRCAAMRMNMNVSGLATIESSLENQRLT